MNIDLKGFTKGYYSDTLGGDLSMVMEFIETAAAACHVEVTTLVVPCFNDSPSEMKDIASWLSGLNNGRGRKEIALHISRYFPRYKLDTPATDVNRIYELKEVAQNYLDNVFTGNC